MEQAIKKPTPKERARVITHSDRLRQVIGWIEDDAYEISTQARISGGEWKEIAYNRQSLAVAQAIVEISQLE